MYRFCLCAALLSFIPAVLWSAEADTVHLRGGVSLDGVVEEINEHAIAVVTPGGRMVLQRSEIERIEENERTGENQSLVVDPIAQLHEQRLKEITGLNAQQRAHVRRLIDPLRSEDPARRTQAREGLIAYGAEAPIYRFIEYNMSFMSNRFAPDLLSVLVALDKDRARPMVRERVEDVFPEVRGRAIALLAETEGRPALPTIARGAIDHDADARIRALTVLGQLRARRATPVLLYSMNTSDRRVVNAAREALENTWGTTFDEDADWFAVWETHRSSIVAPIQPEELEPLVEEQPPETATYHYE